ncbi:MAG TPA: isochorismatase family protein [Acidimicrobiia bacterium]|jgi:nicotinamidase/pyrazinamidase|nr:isochorismatase family protein [Acidimicrobiia bacterium]
MGEVAYDDHTALVVVDLQNDFASPQGSLSVRDAEAVIGPINRELSRARAAGALVVYTRDWHPPETPHFQAFGGKWPVHCVRDTWGAAFHPDLVVLDDAPQIFKATGQEDGYSAFSVFHLASGETGSTGLEALLRERGIERVVLAGLATDYCVLESGLDARRAGFAVVVLHEGVRAVDLEPGDGARALERLEQAGAERA